MSPKTSQIVLFATRIVVSVAILLAGIGIFAFLVATRPQVQRAERPTAERLVEAMDVQPVTVRRRWEGFGTAEAVERANVSAQVGSIVQRLPREIEAGRAVQRGQLLVELDPHDFEREEEAARQAVARLNAQLAALAVEERHFIDQLELAQEEADLARIEHERALEAQERGAANPAEVDRRRREHLAALRAARATREQLDQIDPRRAELEALVRAEENRAAVAARNVQRSRIVSPIDGILQSVAVKEGEQVAPGAVVARVVNLGRIEVPLRFPLSARTWIVPGASVELVAEATGWRWEGEIVRLAPEGDPMSRTLIAFAEVRQDAADSGWRMADGEEQAVVSRPLLVPGQFVRATAFSDPLERTVVPRRAVVNQSVLVAQNGLVEQRQVRIDFHIDAEFPQLGVGDREWAVLTNHAGLEPGERVILTHVDELRPGMRVAARVN